MVYQQLAYVYDRLMMDVPYEKWFSFFERARRTYQPHAQQVLDLGCGTGAVSIPLAQQGFKVTGVDLSEEMLAVAAERAKKEHVEVTWLHQDMSHLELPNSIDIVMCFLDSLNYITDANNIKRTFQRVYQHLHSGGLFIFDLHSLFKIRECFGNHLFASDEEDTSLIWQCFLNEQEDTVEHQLTLFVQENRQLYRRYEELHTQKGYDWKLIQNWLEEVGFVLKEISADFTDKPPSPKSERIFFIAQKAK